MRLTRILTAGLMLILISSCATTGVNDACILFKPIIVPKADLDDMSTDLKAQILRHDEKWKGICGQ